MPYIIKNIEVLPMPCNIADLAAMTWQPGQIYGSQAIFMTAKPVLWQPIDFGCKGIVAKLVLWQPNELYGNQMSLATRAWQPSQIYDSQA